MQGTGDYTFTQQQLKSWHPILTVKAMVIFFLTVGLLFTPLGFILIKHSKTSTDIILDYSRCGEKEVPGPNIKSWRYNKRTLACKITFEVKEHLQAPIYMYYYIENYHQNHRITSKSYSSRQLAGESLAYDELKSCDPVIGPDSDLPEKERPVYYPCGMLANSYFRDTYSLVIKNTDKDGKEYQFSDKDISWPTDKQLYKPTTYDLEKIRIPPQWQPFYGNKDLYTVDTLPDLSKDEHFHNWMRIGTFPNIKKLYGRNNQEDLNVGTYEIEIHDVMDYKDINAKKKLIISNGTWKNNCGKLLGYFYLISGIIFLITVLVFILLYCFAPRRVGDYTLLSWYDGPRKSPLLFKSLLG